MISKLAKSTACFFVENKMIQAEDEPIYSYGMELLLSTVLNFILAVLIAFLTKSFIPCLINLVVFLSIRVNAGGYHADTHLGCMMTLAAVLLIFIIAEKNISFYIMKIVSPVMTILADTVIIVLPPVEHPNKPSDEDKQQRLKNKSIIWVIILSLLSGILLLCRSHFSFYISSGMFTIALAMIAEIIKTGRNNNEKADKNTN